MQICAHMLIIIISKTNIYEFVSESRDKVWANDCSKQNDLF